MNKEQIEIEVKESVDAIALANFLTGITGILKAYVVTGQSLRIYFNSDKLPAKRLLKYIGAFNRKDHRNRKANIVSVKQIKQSA